MATGFQQKLILEFREIFHEEPKTLKEYLSGISRSKMLMVGAHFLGFDNRKSKFNNHMEFFSMYFCGENNTFANELYKRVVKLETDRKASIIIVNALASLQLFEYCFENLNDTDTQTNAEVEVSLFKAYLLLNQLNTDKDSIASKSCDALETEFKFAGMTLAQSFAYSDIANYNLSETFTCQFVKAVYLFEFLSSNKEAESLLREFLKRFNCKTWKDYIKKLVPIAAAIIQNEKEGHLDIVVSKDENYDENCSFIEKLIVLDNEPITDIDFRKIRTAPLYKVEEGRYRIIFGLFVLEKIFKGLYFLLRDVNASLPKEDKIKEFRGFYCDNFSERTLLYEVLKDTYNGKYVEFTGTEMKASGIDAEPDYYIRRGNYVFPFESKDILITAENKTSRDFNLIFEAFKSKLYFEEVGGKISNKAVLQIVKNIGRILRMEMPFDNAYKSSSVRIYPILVIHDQQYNLVGLNVFVNQWFEAEIQKLKDAGINVDRVEKLTIIDIDTLIFYQDAFISRKLILDKVIDEYYKFITFDRKRKYRDQEHLNDYIKRTIIPFSIFISQFSHARGLGKTPAIFLKKAGTLFE